MKRVLTAALMMPVVGYVVLGSHYWILLAAVALVACLCYREYNSIAAAYGLGAPGPVGFGAGLLLLVWRGEPFLLLSLLAMLALVLAMGSGDFSKALPRAALLVTGVVYIFGGWMFALPLGEFNRHWLMFALLINWTGDIGAYYIGRAFGRHKMAPRISPNKSWEGAVGSVAISVLLAGAYLWYFVPGLAIAQIAAVAVVANIAGQLGDLAESSFKRGAGVKDSSAILPGHGGFLDRVDGTLFTLPVVYACIRVLSRA